MKIIFLRYADKLTAYRFGVTFYSPRLQIHSYQSIFFSHFCNFLSLFVFLLYLLQKIGCDSIIGSSAKEDRCGICNGDGKSCRIVKGDFNHSKGMGESEENQRIICVHLTLIQTLSLTVMRHEACWCLTQHRLNYTRASASNLL